MARLLIPTQHNNLIVLKNSNQYLLDAFIAYLDISPKSIETYKKALRIFNLYLKKHNLKIKDIKRQNILNFKNSLIKSKLKNTTISLYIIVVRKAFSWLTLEKYIKYDVSQNIKSLKISREHKKDALTVEQVKKVLKKIDTRCLRGKRDYALVLLAITTGLRIIEIQRANIQDIREIGGQAILFIQGKGKTDRAAYVKLSEKTLKAIDKYLKIRKIDGEALFGSHSNFSKGERMHVGSISRLIKTVLRKAGIDSDRLTAHSLRHTAATINLIAGGSLEETQELLRHSNINTTMLYDQRLKRINNRSETRIEKAIF